MIRTNVILCVVAIICVLTLTSVIGCNKDLIKNDLAINLNGSWSNFRNAEGDIHEYRFNDGFFESFDGNEVFAKGNYSINQEEITLTTTHVRGRGDHRNIFFNRDEYIDTYSDFLERLSKLSPPRGIDDFFPSSTYRVSVEGDVLQLSYPTSLDVKTGLSIDDLIKQSNNNPGYVTVTSEWTTMKYNSVKQ